jgi:hypothetical protein
MDSFKVISEKINLKEERFILIHSFKGFSPCSLVPLLWANGKTEHHGGRA